MAKTVKIGDEYYSEGVRVPAPKKKMVKKTEKKKVQKKSIDMKKAWSDEAERRRKFNWGK